MTTWRGAFAALPKHRIEALLVTHNAQVIITERRRMLALAEKQRLPVATPRSEFADDGALMSYSSLLADQYRRAAQLADRILRGAKPAELPVEQPTKFELVINLKTAKTLGLTLSQSFILLADRVIE